MVNHRTRVVHVITRMILGGAQEDALLSLVGLKRTGRYDVGLVCGPELGPEGELLSRARDEGIPVHIEPHLRRELSPGHDLAAAISLRGLLRRIRPDIVQTHSSKAGIVGRWAARHAGVPVVVHRIHGLAFGPFEGALRNAIYTRAERLAARWADSLVVVADAMKDQARAEGIGADSQYVRIPTGMEVAPYLDDAPARRNAIRAELGFEPHHVVAITVARLFERKGHDTILDRARSMLGAHDRLRFLFVGGGPWEDRLRRRAADELPPGTVRFTGLVPPERVPGLLAASDLMCHPSEREGLPRVIVQSLLAARPVVAFDVDGTREVVDEGESGFLAARDDAEGLAAAVIRLADDAGMRQRFGQAGRRRCVQEFSADALVNATDALYTRLMADRSD